MSSDVGDGALRPAMAGDGYYNAHSPQQAAIAAMSEAALRRAASSLPDSVTASVIADYGCSQGRNSIGPVRVLLDELRRRSDESQPWSVVHNDLPGNDWTTLFATVLGTDSYLTDHEDVYPSAIGRSFYDQVLPDGSVAVGWSGTSVLWLSRRPDVGPDNLFSVLATGDDVHRWADAAAADWRTFLAHRARELAPGGRLVMSSLEASDVYPPFLRLIRDAVRAAAGAGAITTAEAAAMTVPTHQRTRDEIEAPFSDDDLGLVIDDHTACTAPDPAWASFSGHGDVERFADDEVAQIRGWSEPSLASSIDPARGPRGVTDAVEGVYAAIRAAVAADPATGHCDWTMSLLTVSRTP
jgi:hypothetical protein